MARFSRVFAVPKPRVDFVRGLRFRLMVSYVLFFTLLLVVIGLVFHKTLQIQTEADVQDALDPNSPLAIRLNLALEQMTATARSIGDLADYLRRNPSALVRGKYVSDKDQ